MPEICRFYGLVITMYCGDHLPPHFHVRYNEYLAVVDIRLLALKSGKLPPRALGLVMEWASVHQEALLLNWEKAQKNTPPDKISPLF